MSGYKRQRREHDPNAPTLLRDQPKGLPVGWVACYDPQYKRTYYFDLAHDCAQWEVPTEQSAIEPASTAVAPTGPAVISEHVDESKLPRVSADLLIDERRAYHQVVRWAANGKVVRGDEGAVRLMLAAVCDLIRSDDAAAADAVEFLCASKGFQVQTKVGTALDLKEVEQPLHIAVGRGPFHGAKRIITALLKKGANPKKVDKSGHSARDLALTMMPDIWKQASRAART